MGAMVSGSQEPAVTEQASSARPGWTGIRVSLMVKHRLAELAAEYKEDWGRNISYNEVIEQLLADQWGKKR